MANDLKKDYKNLIERAKRVFNLPGNYDFSNVAEVLDFAASLNHSVGKDGYIYGSSILADALAEFSDKVAKELING